MSLNAFVYLDVHEGNDENPGSSPEKAVYSLDIARSLATAAGGKCRGIKKLNDPQYVQRLLEDPNSPLPCGDCDCRPCLRAASIAKCFGCGTRTWQQAMKAGLCRVCSRQGPADGSLSPRVAAQGHAQARYNANRRIRRLLNDIRRECEVNNYQAYIGLKLGNQVHTYAFNCCTATAHGQSIAFHCEDGTVLPQDLEAVHDRTITDAIEKTGTKDASTWHNVRSSLVQWHKSFKSDRQIKDRINKAKKNLRLCQRCIYSIGQNGPLDHAQQQMADGMPSQVNDHQMNAPDPHRGQFVGVVMGDDQRHQQQVMGHHPPPQSTMGMMKAPHPHQMGDENPNKRSKMSLVNVQGLPMSQMPPMSQVPHLAQLPHVPHPQMQQMHHGHPQHPQMQQHHPQHHPQHQHPMQHHSHPQVPLPQQMHPQQMHPHMQTMPPMSQPQLPTSQYNPH